MSQDYREKLAVLCDLIKKNGQIASDLTAERKAAIRRMCSQLRESRRAQRSEQVDLAESGGGGGGLFTALVVCAAGYYYFLRTQPQPRAAGNAPQAARRNPSAGNGGTLGGNAGGGTALTPQQLREARLQKFATASGGGGVGTATG
jgi:hypothetical protein